MIRLLLVILAAVFFSCHNPTSKGKETAINKIPVMNREPDDSASYKHIKDDFYWSKGGQLCERKLVPAKGTPCNCSFEVYYDSTFSVYTEDTIIVEPLSKIVDIESFVWLDSTQYSKDKNKVFYFQGNSDGGTRTIVTKADPATFKRLCEYRWGMDDKHVFFKGSIIEGVRLKYLQVLHPPDTADPFIWYIKDDRNVFFENNIVKGADAKTFKVVSGHEWEAEDKNDKYRTGRKWKPGE